MGSPKALDKVAAEVLSRREGLRLSTGAWISAMVAMGRLADSVPLAPLTVHGERPIRLSSTARVHNGPEQPVGVVAGALVFGRQGVVPAPDGGGADVGDPVVAEGGQDMEAQEALVLGPGRVFEVAPGLQPLAGVVAEELFAETGVDLDAATGVGLLVGQPGVGVCLGRRGQRGSTQRPSDS